MSTYNIPAWWSSMPATLSITGDIAIESILRDIPFFSVGLFAFGIVTTLMLVKRMNVVMAVLFLSALTAFVAGILDLAQLFVRGPASANSGKGLSLVVPLIISREVGLSSSIGLRHLFFWLFVFRNRSGDIDFEFWAKSKVPRLRTLQAAKWLLLALPPLIFVLQLLWRIIPQFGNTGPIYTSAAMMQIVSALFFIFILVSSMISAQEHWLWAMTRRHGLPIVALFFEIGGAVGSLFTLPFSETILGRLLQAVELYLLMVTILVRSYEDSKLQGPPDDASFFGLPVSIQDGPAVTFPAPGKPIAGPSAAQPTRSAGGGNTGITSPRSSLARRLSMSPPLRTASRMFSGSRSKSWAPYDHDDERLWTQSESDEEQALGQDLVVPAVNTPSNQSPADFSPAVARTAEWKDPMMLSVLAQTPLDDDAPQNSGGERTPTLQKPLTVISRLSPNVQEPPVGSPQVLRAAGGRSSPISVPNYLKSMATDFSFGFSDSQDFASFKPMEEDFIIPPSTPQPDDDSRPGSASGRDSSSDIDRMTVRSMMTNGTGLDELLRQQSELDRTIEHLNLFSTSPDDLPKDDDDLRRPSGTSSDFSLQEFPLPPRESGNDTPKPGPGQEIGLRRRSGSVDSARSSTDTIRLHRRKISVPETTTSSIFGGNLSPNPAAIGIGRTARPGKAARGLEITSFIGGFSRSSELSVVPASPALSISGSSTHTTAVVTTAEVASPVRPSLVKTAMVERTEPALKDFAGISRDGTNQTSSAALPLRGGGILVAAPEEAVPDLTKGRPRARNVAGSQKASPPGAMPKLSLPATPRPPSRSASANASGNLRATQPARAPISSPIALDRFSATDEGSFTQPRQPPPIAGL